MRLFVAVVPPPPVIELLSGLPRPTVVGVRWTTPDQWHVTLRFLGEADPDEPTAALAALSSPATEAVLGPAVALLNPRIVSVAVGGLEAVAAEVIERTAEIGQPPERRAFRGHVTLARLKNVRGRELTGAPIEARWPVAEVHLIRSELSPRGARYETVQRFPLVR